jgi:TRAP-type C4-dicarboxylate transport system permease small subunit
MRAAKWFDEHLEETFLVIFLVMISCVMLLQVFMRKVLNSSLSWPEEFCRYCYVWTVFFSLGFTVRQGNMLRVGVVMDLLPKLLRKLSAILVNALCLVIFTVFFVNSISVVKVLKEIGQTSTAMRLPMYIVYFCTFIGFGFAVLRTVQALYKQVKHFNDVEQTTLEAIKEEAEAEAAFAKADLHTAQKKE